MRAVQKRVFGEELPRGHGHKGKISTKMSLLYDELTGRKPRKRRSKISSRDPRNDFSVVKEEQMMPISKRPLLRPQTVLIGVIGNGTYAKLIVQRLLQNRHQVVTLNTQCYNLVIGCVVLPSLFL